MSETTVRGCKRYTLVIPSRIRRKTGIKEGDLLKIRLEGRRLVLEPVEDPFKVLGELIGEPYDEGVEERKAEKWLMRHAGDRY